MSAHDSVLPGRGGSRTLCFRCLAFSITEMNYGKSSFLMPTQSLSRPGGSEGRFHVGSLLCEQMQKCQCPQGSLVLKTENNNPGTTICLIDLPLKYSHTGQLYTVVQIMHCTRMPICEVKRGLNLSQCTDLPSYGPWCGAASAWRKVYIFLLCTKTYMD